MDYKTTPNNVYNALEWEEYSSDPENMRNMKLGFARVGVFNPQTTKDMISEYDRGIDAMAYEREFWHMERNHSTEPIVIKRINKTIVSKEGHNRKNSFFYKRLVIQEQVAPVQFTAHSLARYREKAHHFLPSEAAWTKLPKMPAGVDTDVVIDGDSGGAKIRKDIMLPYGDGAFLGQPLMCSDTVTRQHFHRRKGLVNLTTEVPAANGFRAWTYIRRHEMLPNQKKIFELYNDGYEQEASDLMDKTVNHNQVYEVEDFSLVSFDPNFPEPITKH